MYDSLDHELGHHVLNACLYPKHDKYERSFCAGPLRVYNVGVP